MINIPSPKQPIYLRRFLKSPRDLSDPVNGVFGLLELPSGLKLFTIERPDLDNAKNISCIPEGTYELRLRESNVVMRSSSNEFRKGWEVMKVPGRTHIMIHPGNWSTDLQGCIAVGNSMTFLSGSLAVATSRNAFRKLMAELENDDVHYLVITTEI